MGLYDKYWTQIVFLCHMKIKVCKKWPSVFSFIKQSSIYKMHLHKDCFIIGSQTNCPYTFNYTYMHHVCHSFITLAWKQQMACESCYINLEVIHSVHFAYTLIYKSKQIHMWYTQKCIVMLLLHVSAHLCHLQEVDRVNSNLLKYNT